MSRQATPDALVLTDVTKSFGTFLAVDRLSVRVPAGQILGFLGPNGAGKTTTIRMVMSINYPDSGSIEILGHPRALDVKDRIGYLPEERGLYRKMTVDQTLRYFGQLKGLHGAALTHRIGELLASVGLESWRKKSVESLSKGMQQKIQFISTVLHDPELIILDEPFSGLDPLNRDMLENLIVDLRRRGRTVIFSTHQMEQAERLCDRILLIHRGRKLIDGTVHDIRSQFPSRRLAFAGEGDFSWLRTLPGVNDAHITVGAADVELADGVDTQPIVQEAAERCRLTRFEVIRPSLQEIFVKLVGDVGDEDTRFESGDGASNVTAGDRRGDQRQGVRP
ncbi:MAG: ABC transporter ATP-binding protein [Planctomycetota bacterium]